MHVRHALKNVGRRVLRSMYFFLLPERFMMGWGASHERKWFLKWHITNGSKMTEKQLASLQASPPFVCHVIDAHIAPKPFMMGLGASHGREWPLKGTSNIADKWRASISRVCKRICHLFAILFLKAFHDGNTTRKLIF